MIRSDLHQFIFLRVPKNASSSLAQWFVKNYTGDYCVYTEVNDGGIPAKNVPSDIIRRHGKNDSHHIHMTLQDLVNEKLVTQNHLNLYKTIAVIRNPYERQLSLFFFLAKLRKYEPTVEQFRKDFAQGVHVSDFNNKILQSSYTVVNGIDYGTWWAYENIEKETFQFQKIHGLAKTHLGKLKTGITKKELLEEYYTDEIKSAVRSHFDDDFRLYNRVTGKNL